MKTLGISIARLEPGEVDLRMDYSADLTQQHGFARGELFAFRATVVKPGRTLTVCEGRAYAEQDGNETLIATMSGTLMALPAREGAASQGREQVSA